MADTPHPHPKRERERIIENARRTRAKIEDQFREAARWNACHPEEEPIDVDPDGALRKLRDGLDRMLADDTGSGPIPPIGGWLDPVFGRSKPGEKPS